MQDSAQSFLPPGRSIGDYHQRLLGQDLSFAWRHWQLWAEAYEVRFGDDARAISYYIEMKYKFAPQLFAAVRWNQEFFAGPSELLTSGESSSRTTSRIEGAVTYRFSANTQLKLEYLFQDEQPRDSGHTLATQLTFRF